MYFVFLTIILSCSSSPFVFSQNKRTAQKVDEYSGDYRYEDEIARIDAGLAVLTPSDYLYIIGYGLPGTARRRARRIYDYIVQTHRIDSTRVVPVVGGFLDEQAVEFWVVPQGADPPVAMPAFTGQIFDVARQYDDFLLEGEWFAHQNDSILLDGFADILKSNPKLRGYLIVHKRRGRRCEYCYFQGKELKFVSNLRRYLVETRHIALPRIKVLDKGFGNDGRVELWLVPKDKCLL